MVTGKSLFGALSFWLAGSASAGDIRWAKGYEAALAEAQAGNKVVFVAVNMDGELANDHLADKVYHSEALVGLASETVNLVASRFEHGPKDAECKRFGGITCSEHQWVEKAVRGNLIQPTKDGEVVAPQHLFLGPDGQILLSVAYYVTEEELLWCFVTALTKVDPKTKRAMPRGARPPLRLKMDSVEGAEAVKTLARPLSKEELREAIKRLQSGFGALEDMDTFGRVLATDDPEAVKYAEREVGSGFVAYTSEMAASVLRTIGRTSPPAFWGVVAPLLEHHDAGVRMHAAVALEQLAADDSNRAVQKALSGEKDEFVQKELLRALGTTGRGNAGARKLLLRHAKSDKSALLRANALLALGLHADEKEIGQFLRDVLAQGGAGDVPAAALGLAFARQADFADAIQDATERVEAGDKQTLERCLAVLKGGNLDALAGDFTRVGRDRQRRERFFGLEPSAE
jgi:hypothetical protein